MVLFCPFPLPEQRLWSAVVNFCRKLLERGIRGEVADSAYLFLVVVSVDMKKDIAIQRV